MTAIHRGQGVFFTGNSFTPFTAGDVFVVGSNVPHLIKNDLPGVYAVSLFFHENSFGSGFFDLPELSLLKTFLKESARGLRISGTKKEILNQQISDCRTLKGIQLFRQLLSILENLSKVSDSDFLNKEAFIYDVKEPDAEKLNQVFQFSIKNISRKIELKEAAAIANLSTSQFCRYFKLHTRKTYFRFLNELRIETACKSLAHSDTPIAQIGFEVGFGNLSNFNRQFKKVKGMTPSRFRKAFLDRS